MAGWRFQSADRWCLLLHRYEPTTFQTTSNNTTGIGSAFEDIPNANNDGIFEATNITTGKVVWKVRVHQPAKSGLAVAGNVVFFGEGNGKFHAVNAATGTMLWTFDGTSVPNGGGANANPSAYVIDGQAFVVKAFGGNAVDRDSFECGPPDREVVKGCASLEGATQMDLLAVSSPAQPEKTN